LFELPGDFVPETSYRGFAPGLTRGLPSLRPPGPASPPRKPLHCKILGTPMVYALQSSGYVVHNRFIHTVK